MLGCYVSILIDMFYLIFFHGKLIHYTFLYLAWNKQSYKKNYNRVGYLFLFRV